MLRLHLPRLGHWVAAPLAFLLAGAAAADIPATADELREELRHAAAIGDTVSLRQWTETAPDRVYLATVEIAERAIEETDRAEEETAADLNAAAIVAAAYRRSTGNHGLANLVELYASYDTEQVAQHNLADSLGREGYLLVQHGNYDQGLELLTRAMEYHQELGDAKSEGLGRVFVGWVLMLMNDNDTAREHLQKAVELEREIGFAAYQARALACLGGMESRLGNLQRAIEASQEAYRIGLALNDDAQIARSLGTLAEAYRFCGRYYDALAMNREAQALFRRLGNSANTVVALVQGAMIQAHYLAQYNEAAEALEEAIEIAAREGYERDEALAVQLLARVEAWRGRSDRALRMASRGVSLAERCDDPEILPAALVRRGRILWTIGRLEEARQDLARAVALGREGSLPRKPYDSLAKLAFVEADLGHPQEALAHAREAIDLFEADRRQIGVQELRAGFLDLTSQIYQAALRPLLDLDRVSPGAGYAAQALQLSEQYKARTMLDFLTEREAPEPSKASRNREILATRMSSLQLALLTIPKEDAKRDSLSRGIRIVRSQLDSLEIAASKGEVDLTPGVVFDADSVMHGLRWPGDVLLEFSWGEWVYGWVVTSKEIRYFEVGAVKDLEALIALFANQLRDPSRAALDSPVPFQLAQRLLGPISEYSNQVERLIIVPDGPLSEVPFEALPYAESAEKLVWSAPEGKAWDFLINRFEISYAPSASLWRYLTRLAAARPPAPGEVMAFGNPSLETESGGRRWRRLAYADLEMAEIDRILSPRRTEIFLSHEASEARVKSGEASSYRALHFATHANTSNVDPSASGLFLASGDGSDGFLSFSEILGLNLEVDLVTLSACETGRGRVIRGEGILGLGRAFFYAGSASVLASLWEVDDEHTARMMSRFYHHLAAGERKGAALTLVKRECLAGEGGLSPHPYFWAPFVLIGDADGTLTLTTRRWYEQAIAWPLLGIVLAIILAGGCAARRRGAKKR